VSRPVICPLLDLHHSKLPQHIVWAAAYCRLPRKNPPAHPNSQRQSLNRQSGLAEPPQRGGTAG
jgi:hypothetical protein